jgi:hypothetical protein
MNRTVVVEIDAWQTATDEHPDYDKLVSSGFLGVLVKNTQGATWVNRHGADVARRAHGAGLMVGLLHYAEPWRNTAEAEAEWALGNAPPVPLGLGIVCEIDSTGTMPDHELGPWLTTWLGATDRVGEPSATLMDYGAHPTIVGFPLGHPWWSAGGRAEGVAAPFAVRAPMGDDTLGANGTAIRYVVNSVRGLNPPGGTAPAPPPTAPVAPPEPPEATPDPVDAPPATEAVTGPSEQDLSIPGAYLRTSAGTIGATSPNV